MTSGPVIIGVHGWLLSRKVWTPLERRWGALLHPSAEPQDNNGWRLWCPDLPGFGERRRTGRLRPTLAAYGHWLAESALEKAGGSPFVLMGHSLGASVVLHAASQLKRSGAGRFRGVVCIAAGGGIYQPRAFRTLRRGGRWAVNLRPPLPLKLGPFQAEQRAALGLLTNSTCRGAVQQIPRLVADLAVESLWISGSDDRVMEPRYVRHLAGYNPRHSFISIDKCGHLPMQTHPQTLKTTLETWLGKQA